MSNVAEGVKASFEAAGIQVDEVKVERYSEASFGDYVALVDTARGSFRIESDRGQCFIDVRTINESTYSRGDSVVQGFTKIYGRDHWTLDDLTDAIARVK